MTQINVPNSFKEFATKKAEEICYETGIKGVRCTYVLDAFSTVHPLTTTLVDKAGGKSESDVAISVKDYEMHISDSAYKNLNYAYYLLIWGFILLKARMTEIRIAISEIDTLALEECHKDNKDMDQIKMGFIAMIKRDPNEAKDLRAKSMAKTIESLYHIELSGREKQSENQYMLPDGIYWNEKDLRDIYDRQYPNSSVFPFFEDFLKKIKAELKQEKSSRKFDRGGMVAPPITTPEERIIVMENCPDCKTSLKVHPAYNTKDTLFCPDCGSIYKSGIKI